MTTDALSILLHETYRGTRATASEAKLRLTLLPGELVRVPRSASRMSVLSGRAWLSFCTNDVMVTAGEGFEFPRRAKKDGIIQAVGKRALVLELH